MTSIKKRLGCRRAAASSAKGEPGSPERVIASGTKSTTTGLAIPPIQAIVGSFVR
jgi:hypothetical protein